MLSQGKMQTAWNQHTKNMEPAYKAIMHITSPYKRLKEPVNDQGNSGQSKSDGEEIEMTEINHEGHST